MAVIRNMIKFINAEAVLPVRNEVLRNGKLTLNECIFPTDNSEGAFHLGFYAAEELACIASFSPQIHGDYRGIGYQLRGMATIAKYRGKGFGTQLVNFAVVYLQGKRANYVWCNARKVAVKFYMDCGFEVISSEFNIPGIGPHYVMYLKIK